MKIKDVMAADVVTCQPETNLAVVAKLMWDHDCGFVPVVDAAGRVTGVITDRDICIATATRRQLPEEISAAAAMRREPIHTVRVDDPPDKALATMKQFQVRRLPVLGADGTLQGVVSMNDIVLSAGRKDGPAPAEIVSTLAAICAHRPARARPAA